MKFFLYLIIILTLFISCNIDHGIEPIRSSIQGTIFYTGDWPAQAEEVRLVAANKFPPSSINDLIIGESIPLTGESFNYAFYLKPGTYKVIGVAWRELGSTWDIASICGLYFSGPDSLSPGEAVIMNDTSTVKGIDIFVNRSKAHRITDSQIIGSIEFEGTWPDSIIDVRVIATTKFQPEKGLLPTLLDISFSENIDMNIDSSEYVINAFPGNYTATGVLFFKANQSLSLADIFYSGSVGGLNYDDYEVTEYDTVRGPDFHIKFTE